MFTYPTTPTINFQSVMDPECSKGSEICSYVHVCVMCKGRERGREGVCEKSRAKREITLGPLFLPQLANSQSDHPCDECYRGSAPATELEVKAITDYIESFGHSLLGVIDFHSYYQEVVYPPGKSLE